MKKKFILLSVFFISIIIFSQDIPERFYGTYLPEKYIKELINNKIHIKALLENKKKYYDIICIKGYNGEAKIFSNLGFHDQYTIETLEFQHNWKNKDSKIITDRKNNKYTKISNGTNYYEEIRRYISKQIFSKKKYKNKKNKLQVLDNGNIIFNNDEFRLNLDYMFRNSNYDEFYFKKDKIVRYILIELIDKKIKITEIKKEFPEGEKIISTSQLE